MKSSDLDSTDRMKGVKRASRVLNDGTCVKEYKETQTQSDGTSITKKRISRTYASSGASGGTNPLRKSIKTSITRADADGFVRTTTTTEELITAPNSIAAEPNSTMTEVLPDGSGVITTRNSNILSDGSLSTVITKVHMKNPGSKDSHQHQDIISEDEAHVTSARTRPSNTIRPPRIETLPSSMPTSLPPGYSNISQENYDERVRTKMELNRSNNNHNIDPGTSGIETLPSGMPNSLPPGFNNISRDNYDERLRIKMELNSSTERSDVDSSLLESIKSDDDAVLPPGFADVPGVEMIAGRGITSKAEADKLLQKSTNSRVETIDSVCEEPIPLNFVTEKSVLRQMDVDSEQAALIGKNDVRANKNAVALETMDTDCEEPIPLVFQTATTTTISSKTFDLEGGQTDGKDPRSTEFSKPDKEDKEGRHTLGSHPASGRGFGSDYVSGSTANLAVATPVVDDEEKPIYEAFKYHARISIYKSRRCMVITIVALLVIGAAVSVGVILGTKKSKEDKVLDEVIYETPAPTSAPTIAPTTARDSTLPQIIERNALTRNASFSSMSDSDPRLLSLDWILHEDEMQLGTDSPDLIQRYTLALMAYQLDYSTWFNDNSTSDGTLDWLTGSDVCTWYGITCTDGAVTEIELSENNLIGSIPPEISNLHSLEMLVLNGNCLTGTIPLEMGMLTNLQHFDINYNGLFGIVPSEFFNLSQVEYLDLSYQSNSWTNCTTSNGDVVSPVYHMGYEENGYSVGLKGNFLEETGQLRNLKLLKLGWNSFTGSISPSIENLQQLEILSAGGNWLNGTIPKEISKLPHLKKLMMATNTFSGPLPDNIGDAKALEVIDLNVDKDGRMNGTIPDSLYTLEHLTDLNLFGHAFSGEIKTNIGNLANLTAFRISRNEFTGTLPSELGLCEKLEFIWIHGTNIGGSVPEEVCSLRNKNLVPAYSSQNIFQADCSLDGGKAFIECDSDCCTHCCVHPGEFCSWNG